ncbi:uncharacterized protein LOC103188822 isoform X3 [Callorhinchus milii]|uniref:uncharacterized protein LOC103188822 isoform X3 n=1 Tax=Callorhinchus milii TaxID=7868 RepID=UPI00045746C9|nr:uncharacterized protein LOC103188822 isoform X3 [Callorhinchus milii]|eukprot:gi/632980624/ref/XP_007907138.1/ PREDICTED: centromere protein R isoform X5 [Callorhinchus milii]
MKPRRPVKRSLQLDKKREGETTPNKKLRRLSPAKYSPITGTHILSSFTSRDVGPDDTSTDAADLAVQAHRATTREQQHSEERDEFSALRSKVEASVSILKATREKLLCLWVSGENGYGHPSFGSDVRSRLQRAAGSWSMSLELGTRLET